MMKRVIAKVIYIYIFIIINLKVVIRYTLIYVKYAHFTDSILGKKSHIHANPLLFHLSLSLSLYVKLPN